jgi:hypothetical protein
MSKDLSSVQIKEFDDEVKHAFQGASKLEGTVTYRGNVTGGQYDFRLMGKGEGTLRGAPSSDVVPMDITHSKPTATLSDWEFPEYTDIYKDAEVNFDEVTQLATTIAKAGMRRKDQITIDAMAAGTFNATLTAGEGLLVGTDVGGVGTGLNVAKLRAVKKMFVAREADEDIFIAIDSEGLDDLLAETEVTSSDYSAVKALVQGEVDTFLGMKFITIGNRTEGGLNLTGSLQDGFAWTASSVGCAVGIDLDTDVDWVPTKSSWLSNAMLKMGAVIIDNEGVAKVQYTV